jgi:spore maturation protein CgeB
MWMDGSDFRWGLFTTLLRKHKVWHYTLNQDFIKDYSIYRPDLFISFKGSIPPELKDQMKADGCKTIQLFPDDPDEYEKGKVLAREYDHYFTNSLQALEWYHRDGFGDVKICAFAVDEKLVERVKPGKEFKCDILFAGGDNKKRYRYTYLNALAGLDLKVFGKWNRAVYGLQNRVILGDDYFSALKSCKIGIDLSESGAGYMNVKAKTFELAAAGCLVVSNKFEEMERYFEYDKEIVGFSSPVELKKKCEYYLEHEDERLRIAQAGQKRFYNDHTWCKRLKYIFKEIGIE